jgi:uncharacterized membrane protein
MNLDPLLSAPWHIQLHVFSALAALGLGVVQFTAPKGTIPHRVFGYVWVTLMVCAAVTAIFIREINQGGFSWIHILIPITLFGVVELSVRARRGLIGKHRTAALVMFFAALLIPGAFSFMPGRIMLEVVAG